MDTARLFDASPRDGGDSLRARDTVERPPPIHGTVAMKEASMHSARRDGELATTTAAEAYARLQAEIQAHEETEDELRLAQAQLDERAVKLERVVAVRTAELTAINQQLESFVYSIAHDLRAPLRSMQGFAALLTEEAAATLSATGRDYAERINRSAQFMDALLSDLLAFSRISQQAVELAPASLSAIMESLQVRLQKELGEKSARLECLGPWPEVRAHEPTLAQVLFNLVSNAVKFARPGVAPIVWVRTEERAGVVRVWIEDNGLGIAAEHQQQIFGLFTRLHGEKYPGTGIGLAIVQKGVERMGGRVGVESTPGHGSRFWIELARAPLKTAGPAASAIGSRRPTSG